MLTFTGNSDFLAANKYENLQGKCRKFPAFAGVFSRLYFQKGAAVLIGIVFLFVANSNAQAKKPKRKISASRTSIAVNLPKVTQIDAEALKNLLKPNGKPLLINFWATWCDPCREEFPDLVKIAADYKGKIDLITISLDDLAEINRDVPKFLAQMKSDSPAYLLKTADEGEAIAAVAKDWQGGLPFTIFFNEKGETVYSKQGKFKTELLRAEIGKTIEKQAENLSDIDIVNLIISRREIEESAVPFLKGKDVAQKDIASENLRIIRYGERTNENLTLKEHIKVKYAVGMLEFGCKVSDKLIEFVRGYNEVSEIAIKRKYGANVLKGIF